MNFGSGGNNADSSGQFNRSKRNVVRKRVVRQYSAQLFCWNKSFHFCKNDNFRFHQFRSLPQGGAAGESDKTGGNKNCILSKMETFVLMEKLRWILSYNSFSNNISFWPIKLSWTVGVTSSVAKIHPRPCVLARTWKNLWRANWILNIRYLDEYWIFLDKFFCARLVTVPSFRFRQKNNNRKVGPDSPFNYTQFEKVHFASRSKSPYFEGPSSEGSCEASD